MDIYENDYAQLRENTTKPSSPYADSPYVTWFESNGIEPTKGEPKKTKKERGSRKWISALLILLLIVSCCGITALTMNHYWQGKYILLSDVLDNRINALQEQLNSSGTLSDNVIYVEGAADGGLTPAQIYEKNASAVVAVRTDVSQGTGCIVSESGYVISNYHVVSGGKVLKIITTENKEFDAKLIGVDKTSDVAVLKIEAEDMPCVTIGDSDVLKVGDRVVVVGNALGELTATLTAGYISGKDRIVNTDGTSLNMLQTDAAINSGNSGGPLFNANGEVVGITTAKYTGTSSSGATIEGIGFAIPINDVLNIVDDLCNFGYVTGAYLGVMVKDVSDTVIREYGFPAGAYIDEVISGLSADNAGIRGKDIITNVGGYDVTSVADLTRVLRKFKAGETTTVTVFRSGTEVHLNLTFGEKPRETETQTEPTQPTNGNYYGFDYSWWAEMFPFFEIG